MTVSDGNTMRPCGTSEMPLRAIRYGSRPLICSSLKRMTPSRGGVRPMIERMIVVLPMPLRPSMATMLPWGTLRETSQRTCVFQ